MAHSSFKFGIKCEIESIKLELGGAGGRKLNTSAHIFHAPNPSGRYKAACSLAARRSANYSTIDCHFVLARRQSIGFEQPTGEHLVVVIVVVLQAISAPNNNLHSVNIYQLPATASGLSSGLQRAAWLALEAQKLAGRRNKLFHPNRCDRFGWSRRNHWKAIRDVCVCLFITRGCSQKGHQIGLNDRLVVHSLISL